MKMLKIPVQLVKRMSDGPTGEQRWQVEVPERYQMKGVQLEPFKGHYFIIMGPFGTEEEIERVVKGKSK